MDHSSGEFAYYLSQIGITQTVFGWLAVAVSAATAVRVYFYLHAIVKRASLEIRVLGEASLADWVYSISIGLVEISMLAINILYAATANAQHIYSLLSIIISCCGWAAAWAYANRRSVMSALAYKAYNTATTLKTERARGVVSR